MGSYVRTTSTAVDKRLAVTDNGFGFSAGNDNNLALNGHIFDIRAGTGGGSSPESTNVGAGVNISLLDGNAISQSFSLADNALSNVLSSVIEGQKLAKQSTEYTADAVAKAVSQAANIQTAAAKAAAAFTASSANTASQSALAAAGLSAGTAAATAAATNAAAAELQKNSQAFIQENGKKLLIAAGVAFGAYLLFFKAK